MTNNPNGFSRRTAIKSAMALGAAASIAPISAQTSLDRASVAIDLAKDESYWKNIAADFDVNPDIINLENGYWGIMARPVLEKYIENTRVVNRNNSYYARRGYNEDYTNILRRIETELGAKEGEIALTRNATEALQGLINGYNGLKSGDAVLYTDLDYYSMVAAMDTLAARENCTAIKLDIPEPVDHQGLIEFYRRALTDHPQVKLLLLTHIGHHTGLVIPVKEITRIARAAGVDVITDAAHSYGQIDIKIDDLGADFSGFNLHKWIGAPLGVGAMYIRENRLNDIAPNPSSADNEKDSMLGRMHTGTMNFAAILTIPDAFDYHHAVGPQNKEARLRYLRDLWVNDVRDLDGLSVLTGDDQRLHAGITSFRFDDKTSVADNKVIVERLLKDHGIFTVHRDGVAKGACVRVTPSIYTSADDVARLAGALQSLATQM